MTTIVQIRGTHGSGKSTLVRQLLSLKSQYPYIALQMLERGKVIGYEYGFANLGFRVLGDYSGPTSGGCDGISKQDDITWRVSDWARTSNVVFEGILASKTFERYAELARAHERRGGRYVWAFLDTPPATCLNRVTLRRERAGNEKPLNPDNVIKGYEAVAGVLRKAKAGGFTVVMLNHKDPLRQLLGLLAPERPLEGSLSE